MLQEHQVMIQGLGGPKNPRPDEPRPAPAPLPEEGLDVGGQILHAWVVDDDGGPTPAQAQRAADPSTPASELDALARQRGDLARLVAANPSAGAALLTRLADLPDRLTQEAVTSNPSTPRAVYFRLAMTYPAHFWANPQLLLLLVEDPTLSSMPAYDLCSLLAYPSAPLEHLRFFSGHHHPSVQEFATLSLRRMLAHLENDERDTSEG